MHEFKVKIAAVLLFFSLALCGSFFLLAETAAQPPSQELMTYGDELFNTKKLGAKFQCILCHKAEKAIEKSKVLMLGDKLPDVINDHLIKKSKGKPLAKDSREMQALVAYITYKHSV